MPFQAFRQPLPGPIPTFPLLFFCMKTGIIKFFNEAKGYGFVTDDETKEDFFVHVTGLNGATVQQNDRVEFETQEGRKGINAVNIRKI